MIDLSVQFRLAGGRALLIRLANLLAAAFMILAGSTVAAGVPAPRTMAIENVTILPMTHDGARVPGGTVLIEEGRILAAGPSADVVVPSGAERIDARGKFLMPALADMHVHMETPRLLAAFSGRAPEEIHLNPADALLPYVAMGVLQIFNLAADEHALGVRAAVERGEILGPNIALAVMVDGDPPIVRPMARVAANPEQGRQIVRDVATAGYDAVKTYSSLDFDTFQAIVDEARQRGLRAIGHIPLRNAGRTAELLPPGFSLVSHAEEFAYQAETVDVANIPRLAQLARGSGVWLTTTLKLNERVVELTRNDAAIHDRPELRYLHPIIRNFWGRQNRYAASSEQLSRREQVVEFNPVLLREFARTGIPLVIGTDTLVAGIVPGFGLHDELEALSGAGLPNDLILAGATRLPAQWLGVLEDRGTVEVGKRADLLLLDADPFTDISNSRRISAVIVGGRYLSRERLDAMMAGLAARYESISQELASQAGESNTTQAPDAHSH